MRERKGVSMKATFEFDLPEDTEEYNIYRSAPGMYSRLWRIKTLCWEIGKGWRQEQSPKNWRTKFVNDMVDIVFEEDDD